MALTGWQIDGNDLRTVGYNIGTTDGWDSLPSRRQHDIEVPYRHGSITQFPKFYQPRDIALVMQVLGTNAAGAVVSSPLEHVQENLDNLLEWFGKDGLRTLTRTMPDTTTRTAQIEVLDGFPVRSGPGISRAFVAICRMPYPFWHGTVVNDTGKTGSTSITNAGNAPMQDAVITFTAAGKITHDASGDWIDCSSVAGGNVIVDMSAYPWTIKQAGADADGLLTWNNPWWLNFQPGVNNLTITATVDIDHYPSWF
jgi:hypothetical protein